MTKATVKRKDLLRLMVLESEPAPGDLLLTKLY